MKRNQWIFAGILMAAAVCFSLGAHADTGRVGQGSLCVMPADGGEPELLDLPLKHTAVTGEISGFIARVEVTQYFENPMDHAIEAVYVFPLPDMAAVDGMTMQIGDRVIKGVIKKREEAQAIYNQARDNGQTASLLTQERPNIFTQAVANILPGDDIRITIQYVQDLKYDHGEYEFNFPMVVGPRFIPGTPAGRSGGGWAPDTDQVPDASRITPPVLTPGTRSGHDIEISLLLDAGLPVHNLASPSHRISTESLRHNRTKIQLDPADTIPNKDFIVRYTLSGDAPEAALLTHADDRGGFFTLMIQPQADFELDEVTPKEMIFVVDCSGSMSGAPMAQAKAAMKKFIAGMNPDDSFQVIRFSSAASKFSPLPLANTPANVQKGVQYVQAMHGSGGTQMIEGIKAALDYPHDSARMRIVVFMTDGYIGNETQILAAIQDKLNGARLFSFGVGSSVNHYLLDRMSEVGRGFVQYVRPDEDTTKAVDLFYERINNPLLTDIQVDWKDLAVTDVYPQVIPDLFSAQPVLLHGRYTAPGDARIVIRGKIRGRTWTKKLDVALPEFEPAHDVLAPLWARTRIAHLMSRQYHEQRQDVVTEITNLALSYNLMSQYTAFVAVSEEVRRDPTGTLETVQVPVEIPDMVSYEGIFGDTDECDKVTATRHKKGLSVPMCAPGSGQTRADGRAFNQTAAMPALGYIATEMEDCEPVSVNRERLEEVKAVAKPRDDRRPVFATAIRMLSGQVIRNQVTNELDSLEQDLENLFAGITGSLHLLIKVDASGRITALEFTGGSISDQQLENEVKSLFMTSFALTRGPGDIALEISRS